MKENHFFQNSPKAVIAFLFAALMSIGFTSCSNNDDNPSPLTPEEQMEAKTFERIKGMKLDQSMIDFDLQRVYQFLEDDHVFICWDYTHCDSDHDGIMDENESVLMLTGGQWKAVGSTYCPFSGEYYDAVALEFYILGIEDVVTEKMLAMPDSTTIYTDTLYLVPVGNKGDAFIRKNDVMSVYMETVYMDTNAATRGFGDFWRVFMHEVTDVIDKGVKWIRKAWADDYDPDVKDQADWMGKVFQNANPKIHEISLPGTHDTFTYGICKLFGNWGKTQFLDLEQQFDAGVRYFDFRLHYGGLINEEWQFNHGPLSCDVYLDDVMKKLKQLLTDHPTEMVVAMLKFEREDPNQDLVDKLKKALEPYKDIIVDPSKVKADIRLNDCRGKILLMQRFGASGGKGEKAYTGADFGIYGNGDDNVLANMGYGDQWWPLMEQDMCEFILYDNISWDTFKYEMGETDHYKKRWNLFVENLQDAANPPYARPDTWHINKTSGYVKALKGIYMSYGENAWAMNDWATEYINSHLGEKTGWIVMDFAGTHEEGAFGSITVYGDDLMKALLRNNLELVKNGTLK